MILLTPDLRYALRANAITAIAVERDAQVLDHAPIVKFFNPMGAATWVATELYADDDTLFGLADLGFGCPEVGTFSLREIEGVYLPFGLRIERDLCFATPHSLSRWAQAARQTGSIIAAEQLLRAVPEDGRSNLPASS